VYSCFNVSLNKTICSIQVYAVLH